MQETYGLSLSVLKTWASCQKVNRVKSIKFSTDKHKLQNSHLMILSLQVQTLHQMKDLMEPNPRGNYIVSSPNSCLAARWRAWATSSQLLMKFPSSQLSRFRVNSTGLTLTLPYIEIQYRITKLQNFSVRVKDGPRGGPTLLSQASAGSSHGKGEEDDVDFSEFLPDFQRINISGEDNTGVQ